MANELSTRKAGGFRKPHDGGSAATGRHHKAQGRPQKAYPGNRCNNSFGWRAGILGLGAEDVGGLRVISDELLARVRDVGAQGGEGIKCGPGGWGRSTRFNRQYIKD